MFVYLISTRLIDIDWGKLKENNINMGIYIKILSKIKIWDCYSKRNDGIKMLLHLKIELTW